VKIQSDLHGDMQSQAEMTWPRNSKPAICGVTNMPKVDTTRKRARVLPLNAATC
jgi:hypothetical protein